MRALLINPESPPSFWTFQETCNLTGNKALGPPLSLITVAALLPGDWQFRLADLNARQLTAEDWHWADLVLLSGMIVQRHNLLSLIREAKGRGKSVAVGGPYPTSLPQEVLDAGADFLVRGEGETGIPLFLAALRQGERQGVFETGERPEMSSSPVPRFDLLKLDDYVTMSIQTSRGCPFDCEFCDVVNLYGRKIRYKQPQQIINELESLYRLGWRREIFISDDNFIGRREQARGILEKLIPWMKAHGKPFNFWTQASVNLGQNLEMMDLLTEANFSHVFLGVESPDQEVLRRNRKYQNLRNPLGQSLTNLGVNGLSIVASFVIGFDHEEKGAGDRICAFVEEHSIPLVMLNILHILPNTSLWRRLEQEGRLLKDRTNGHTEGGRLNYLPTRPVEEILEEYARVIEYLYEPSRFLARTYRYYLNMRPTRRVLAQQQGMRVVVEVKKEPPPWSDRLKDLQGLLRLIWQHGIRPPYRRHFWSQLAGMSRENPSRLKKYLLCLALGDNLFLLRDRVRRNQRQTTSSEVNHR